MSRRDKKSSRSTRTVVRHDLARAMEWKTIPGYAWVGRLSSGGSGEVYAVNAPGGFPKAVKIIPLDETNPLAERERTGLLLMRSIRHPYLLSIDRLDADGDHMTLVMELADSHLGDEFRRRTAAGAVGIPRMRLLQWLDEAAEALDLMNHTYKMQHLDVKPENLFLVGGHLKVGDFGLVRLIESEPLPPSRHAISPHYAAPELFEGKVSKTCDQFSLAVVYMEMLTSRRPHTATELRQAAMQRLVRPPDLFPLPEADREIVARALNIEPAARHESCRALIRALRAASPKEDVDALAGEQFVDAAASGPARRTFPALFDLKLSKRGENGRDRNRRGELAPLGAPTAQTMSTCLANSTPSALMTRIIGFADDWGAELRETTATGAVLVFDARSSWWRRLWRRPDHVAVRLEFHQRDGAISRTLVQIDVAYYGGKISGELFEQYASNVMQLIRSFLITNEAAPTHVRQHLRHRVCSPATIVRRDAEGNAVDYHCRAIDYSARGVGLVSSTPIKQGKAEIQLKGADVPWEMQVVVCQRLAEGEYRIGVLFDFEPAYPEQFIHAVEENAVPVR